MADPAGPWLLQGNTLHCPLTPHQTLAELLRSHLHHRHRLLHARSGVFHVPREVVLEHRMLRLEFEDAALLQQALRGTVDELDDPRFFLVRRLLPLLKAGLDCHAQGIAGFAPLFPVQGRHWPPVAFFVPELLAPELQQRQIQDDLAHWHGWLTRALRALCPGARRLFSSLLDALTAGDAPALAELVRAELRQQAEAHPELAQPRSFLSLLTEAEFLEQFTRIFPYQRLAADQVARLFGVRPAREEHAVEVDVRWCDPHFPLLVRPSPQELWDGLLEEARHTPLLAATTEPPNPLANLPPKTPILRWLGVHPDQPVLYLRQGTEELPARGFLHLRQPGDLQLVRRKRQLIHFAEAHPALIPLYRRTPAPASVPATLTREELPAAIVRTRGLFLVQGPPGTGKTYLATQVVERFLRDQPGARVLLSAKEHFALRHILRTTLARLQQSGRPYRAFRSISRARLQRQRFVEQEEHDLLPETQRQQLAALSWQPGTELWQELQTEALGEVDLRHRSLAEQAANLYACTTTDGAMLRLAGQTGFDLVVVEEAGKCYPSELLHAAGLGRCVLLIGDQHQLPPYQEEQTRQACRAWQTLLEQAEGDPARYDACRARLGSTWWTMQRVRAGLHLPESHRLAWLRPFARLYDLLPASRFRLTEQYRLEAPLSRVINQVFYGQPFEHRKTASSPLAGRLPPDLDVPLLWLDLPHMTELPAATEDPAKCGQRENRAELEVLLAYLRRLPPLPRQSMVILTPYNAQKQLLLESALLRHLCRELLDQPLEELVKSVDEYQGREAELVLLSLVRNNSQAERAWGFLTEPERLNVMFSRARYRLVVIGCAAHIRRHRETADWLHRVLLAWEAEAAHDSRHARLLPVGSWLRHG